MKIGVRIRMVSKWYYFKGVEASRHKARGPRGGKPEQFRPMRPPGEKGALHDQQDKADGCHLELRTKVVECDAGDQRCG